MEIRLTKQQIKLSGLWISLMFLFIYGDYFELYVPKKVESLLNSQNILDSPVKLFAAAVMLAVPALMISLNLFLSQKLLKILNILLGMLYAAISLLTAITSISAWYAFYVTFGIIESLICIVIIITAWKWR